MQKSILIVEDDEDLRRLYRLALALEGYEVECVADGMEALRRIELQRPDLVVLDLYLPGVSGFAVLEEIAAHAQTRNLPIVVVTGSTADVPDAPCVLRKPVAPDQLVGAVRRCLGTGAPGQAT